MKKHWKNGENTGKVDEKILEKFMKNWKSHGNSSVQKSGNHELVLGNKGGSAFPELTLNNPNYSMHVILIPTQ